MGGGSASSPHLLADMRAPAWMRSSVASRRRSRHTHHQHLSGLAGPELQHSFTAFVLRQVPELRVDLPAHAVSKDYLGARVFARPPSGSVVRSASIFWRHSGVLAATEGRARGQCSLA